MIEKKYAAPTKYNKADYGACWEHETDTGSQYFIQVSKDTENPKWMALGDFFVFTFGQSMLNEPALLNMMMGSFELRQLTEKNKQEQNEQ